jgi:hypothetical protein
MYYAEHGVAHFHADYGSDSVTIAIDTLGVLAGSLPPRALGMVLEWATLHRAELHEDWTLLRAGSVPRPIAPL